MGGKLFEIFRKKFPKTNFPKKHFFSKEKEVTQVEVSAMVLKL